MSDHQADYPIATMCRVLGVSSSGYHAWVKRRPSQRAETDAMLIAAIRAVVSPIVGGAVDKWPASAKLLAVATAGHLPSAPTPLSGR